MEFVDFPGTNKSFSKPSEMNDNQCGTLRVKVGIVKLDNDEFIVNTSGWKPSEEDLKRLNEGGLVYLNIFGLSHPVVSVSTQLIDSRKINIQNGNTEQGSNGVDHS